MHCGITHRFATVRLLVLAAICLCVSGSLVAQTFSTLYLFGTGGNPHGALIEGTDGNLYGTTYGYAGKDNGMIFKITPGGSFTMLHQGGEFPSGLTLGTDGNFYGTSFGGYGSVYKMTPSGTFTTLHTLVPPRVAATPPRSSKPATGTSTVRPRRVEILAAGHSSKSPQAVRLRRCTTFAPEAVVRTVQRPEP